MDNEKSFTHSSELAERILNTVREPLIVLDQDLRVVKASRSFYDFFKVKPEETVGQLIYDLGNKQWDIPKLRELLETILPEKAAFDNYEVEHDFASIGRRIMLLNARQIKQGIGKERIILLAIEDVTERQQLEDQLAESEFRYRRLFETASDGIVLLEKKEGHVTHANPAIEKMLGWSEAECLGKNLHDIGVSIDGRDFCETMKDLDREGILNYQDVALKTRTGQEIYTDIYMVDKAILAQCNIRDVSKQKKLEAQLRHAQKMEAVGTLTGGIAHDFNNILNVILGYGSMVLEELGPDHSAREHMSAVLGAADRAASLTSRLLVFSRKDGGKRMPVDINKVIFDVKKMLARIIRENIEFNLELADLPLIVLADVGQIEQILINLVVNAKDAMPEGGRLTIRVGLKEVDDYAAAYVHDKPGQYALITVSDTGQGMDAETQKRIFDPFFTTKDIGKGTGLGLAVSYGIVKQHGGHINVYSEPGHGAVFKIYLPLTEEASSLEKGEEPIALAKSGDETILVAEDEASLRKLSTIVLESFGYSVITAVDGDDAITKFMENRERISLVLLDMIMPKKNGKEVSEAIRKVNPDVRILFSSGYAMSIIHDNHLTESNSDFIHKPFTPQDLLIKIREILDR
jgi:PAS domain S-box-containing protein